MDATTIGGSQGDSAPVNVPNLAIFIHGGWSGYRSRFVYVPVPLYHAEHKHDEQYG